MALMPKSVKYRKSHLGPIRGKAHRGNAVSSGEHGLQSLEAAWVTSRQLESARVTARHYLKGVGRVYIKVFPHKAQTAKPAETRMGKGKGEPEEWVAKVKPGTMMIEIGGVTRDMAKEALRRMSFKLPVRSRMIDRRSS